MSRDDERRRFVAIFHWNHWTLWSFGVSFDIGSPNIEVHLCGGFIRVGWIRAMQRYPMPKTWGIEQQWPGEPWWIRGLTPRPPVGPTATPTGDKP